MAALLACMRATWQAGCKCCLGCRDHGTKNLDAPPNARPGVLRMHPAHGKMACMQPPRPSNQLCRTRRAQHIFLQLLHSTRTQGYRQQGAPSRSLSRLRTLLHNVACAVHAFTPLALEIVRIGWPAFYVWNMPTMHAHPIMAARATLPPSLRECSAQWQRGPAGNVNIYTPCASPCTEQPRIIPEVACKQQLLPATGCSACPPLWCPPQASFTLLPTLFVPPLERRQGWRPGTSFLTCESVKPSGQRPTKDAW